MKFLLHKKTHKDIHDKKVIQVSDFGSRKCIEIVCFSDISTRQLKFLSIDQLLFLLLFPMFHLFGSLYRAVILFIITVTTSLLILN